MMITVIGGSGFIGTRLASRLERESLPFEVLDKAASARFPDVHRYADVRDLESLRDTVSGNVIVNLAAEHRDDVRPMSLYAAVNVEGARHVCNVATEKGINSIIFTSTVAVYGFGIPGTDETGAIRPFNEYGRTKWEAEQIYREWQKGAPHERSLTIVRPTVVFGEQNRGNVYNLFRQIAQRRFLMVGRGNNVKSMAYVENVANFLEYALSFGPGVHLFNYVDHPDMNMNDLVGKVNEALGRRSRERFRVPYVFGLGVGYAFDLVASVTRRSFPISSVRVRKFCATTQFGTSIQTTGFVAPVSLQEGLLRTVRHEFLEEHGDEHVFMTE